MSIAERSCKTGALAASGPDAALAGGGAFHPPSAVFDTMRHTKPRLCRRGVVANPRDTFGYRCGLRLALARNASISFVGVFVKQGT